MAANTLQRARARDPALTEAIPLGWADEQARRWFTAHSVLVGRIDQALFTGLLPKLKIAYSFADMLAFTDAHRRECRNFNDDFPPLHNEEIELEVDETEIEYEAFGARVELLEFCKLAMLLPTPGTACSICVADFDGKEDVRGNNPVLTVCKHFFHQDCLDKWVNESAMKTSNTCPECRTVLCEPRKRLHASLGIRLVAERGVDAISITDSSAAASVAAARLWPRLQRLNAHISSYLNRRGALPVNSEWSDIDDSGISSSDSGGIVRLRRITDIARMDRRDQMRLVNV